MSAPEVFEQQGEGLCRSQLPGWSVRSSQRRHYFWLPDHWKAQFPALVLPTKNQQWTLGPAAFLAWLLGGSTSPQARPQQVLYPEGMAPCPPFVKEPG